MEMSSSPLALTRMHGKAQPDGRPAVELIETQSYLSPVVDQSTRAPQQAEAGTGDWRHLNYVCSQAMIINSFAYLSSVKGGCVVS